MQLENLFQVGEDVPNVSRRQDGFFGEPLVEDMVQHSQHPYMSTFRVKELWKQTSTVRQSR